MNTTPTRARRKTAKKPVGPMAGSMTRAERDALHRTPVKSVETGTSNRVARRSAARGARLARPSAPAAAAPLSRRAIVALRAQTVRRNQAAAAAREA